MLIKMGWGSFQLELNNTEVNLIIDLMKKEICWWKSHLLNNPLPENEEYLELLSQCCQNWEDIRFQSEYVISGIDLLYFAIRTLVSAIGWHSAKDKGWPESVDWKLIKSCYDLKNKIITITSDLLLTFKQKDGGLSKIDTNKWLNI